MPNPRLLHRTPVFLRQIDRGFTGKYDHNLKEPIGQVRRELKPIKLIAQVHIGATGRPTASHAGVVEDSSGYLLFLTWELRTASVMLKRGDRIVQIGAPPNDRAVDYYLLHSEWEGHYQQHGGPTLVKWFFADRKPSRQRGDL